MARCPDDYWRRVHDDFVPLAELDVNEQVVSGDVGERAETGVARFTQRVGSGTPKCFSRGRNSASGPVEGANPKTCLGVVIPEGRSGGLDVASRQAVEHHAQGRWRELDVGIQIQPRPGSGHGISFVQGRYLGGRFDMEDVHACERCCDGGGLIRASIHGNNNFDAAC